MHTISMNMVQDSPTKFSNKFHNTYTVGRILIANCKFFYVS